MDALVLVLLMVVALAGLDDGGRGEVLWVAAELHPVQRGPRMEVWRLVLTHHALSCQLLLLLWVV